MEVRTVPADPSDLSLPHPVLSGRATTLKATATLAGDTLEAFWDFGDGSPGARFTPTDPSDLSARHVYTAPTGSQFSARLTVTNKTTGESASATYVVKVSEAGIATEARIAVEEGLWYLHRSVTRNGDAAGSWRGDCAACDPQGASTATNLLAFERAGFDESSGAAIPYSETIALARAWLTRNADNPLVQSADLEASIAKAGATARAATIDLSVEAARTLLDQQNPAGYWTAAGSESALATGRAIKALAITVRSAASTIFNVSSQVSVITTGFLFSRVTRTFNGTMTVTNISGTAIPGPINVVLTNLPAGVTLANLNGTFNGSPYRTAAGGLNPGQSVPIALSFNNPTGVIISGTPVTYSGTFPPAPVTVGCPANGGTNGVSYNSALNGEGGVQPYLYSIGPGSLPNGLILNPATGVITGSPTASGTFNFTATLVDGTGLPSGTASANCGITISPASSALTLTCPTSNGQVGTPYSSAFVASGGAGGYSYGLQSGVLPPPLVLTPGTGVVSGTPNTAGPFNFTGVVTDANLQTQTANCGINISTASTVGITVTTVPAGLTIVVDGNTLTAPQTFNWTPGSNHTIATTTPQGSGGTRHVFNNWSDGGAIAHTIVTPGSATTFTANFNTEHQLTIAASPSNGGNVTPATGTFFAAGSVQTVTATANSGFAFSNWTGPVASPSSSPTTVTMSAPVSLTANFTAQSAITVTTVPAGLSIIVDGNTFTAPQTFNWTSGSNHTIGTTSPQGSGSTRQLFTNWSDGGAIVHAIVAPSSATTFTATFSTGHQLTTAATPSNGGNVTPASGSFFLAGSVQNVIATANSGFAFNGWTGPVASATSAATTVTMNAPLSVTANFVTALTATCPTATQGNVGTAYSSSVTASGGTASYSYSLQSGTLPPPLTINSSTGLISGTPNAKGTYNFVLQVQDATSPIQQTATANCSILIPNRLPTANGQSISTNEDTAQLIVLTATDPDRDTLIFSLVDAPTKGNVSTFGGGSCGGTSWSCTRAVIYTPSANLNGADSFTFRVSDGEGNSSAVTVNITINAVNDPPVLTAKNFNVQANMRIVATATTMLAGATDPGDPENASPAFTLTAMAPASGAVSFAADGSFIYDPPPGTTGNVNFTYTVCDNGAGATPSACTGGSGTFVIAGPVIHFVNPGAGVNGDGRLQTPFNSLASATTALGANTNQRIFVYSGTTASGAGVTLPTDGWLVGQGVTGASFDAVMGITPSAFTIARPTIGGTHPIIQGTVSMNGNNVNVRGLRIQPPLGTAGLQATLTGPFTGQVVGNIPNITTTGARAVNLNNVSGTYSITAVNASGTFDIGINLSNVNNPSSGSFSVTGTGTANTGGSIGSATADGIRLSSTRVVTLTDISVTNSFDNNLDARNVNGLTINRSTFDTTTGALPGSPDLTERHNFYGLNVRDLSISNGAIFDGGATNALNIHNIKIDNLLGTSVIDNSIVRDGKDMNLAISNSTATAYAGTPDALTIRNNTRFQTPSPGSAAPGDQIQIFSNAVANLSLTVTGNTQISGASQNCVQLVAQGVSPSQGKLLATLDSASMTGNNGPAINLATANNGRLDANINNLTLSSALSSPVNLSNQGNSILTANLNGNTITVSSSSGNGITAEVENDGRLSASISGNNISGNATYGIRGQAKTNGGVLNLTANNNTVRLDSSASLEGIAVEAGSSAGSSNASVCLNLVSNNSTSNPAVQEGYRLRVRPGTTFQLQNFTGSGTVVTDVQNWITNVKGNVGSSQITIDSGASFSTVTSCPSS
ncbi:MAG: cadherin-like domain-containing protein [Bryobacterales bacterium]|nr:cadherin-like domain-containing protein [Bryobacterales bacterium]